MSERFMKNFNGEKIFCAEYNKETLRDLIYEKQDEIKELNDDLIWWTNRFNAVERDNREYKARIDKAIDYIHNNYPVCAGKELLDILQGVEKE